MKQGGDYFLNIYFRIYSSQLWWHKPVILALYKQKEEDQQFMSAWVTQQDFVSKSQGL
jgi:hypothetical protein